MKQAINNIVKAYRKAADVQWDLTTAFYDNYDDIAGDLAQAGTDFIAAIGDEYGETFNLAMVARSLSEAQYTVEEASLFLYAAQKSLGCTGASMALKAAGYELPNAKGGGRPPVSAVDAAVKAMEKVIKEKKPNKKTKAAILAALTELLG